MVYPAAISYLIAGMQIDSPELSSLAARLEGASQPLFFGFLGAYLFTLLLVNEHVEALKSYALVYNLRGLQLHEEAQPVL